MNQKDRELLLKDLSARLPYDVRCKIVNTEIGDVIPSGHLKGSDIDKFKVFSQIEIYPYLRPMSSMTEGEIKKISYSSSKIDERIDFYNSHHLDYRGLIPKGLALEAQEGMYKL